MSDCEEWRFDAENWKFNTKCTKDKVASRLYSTQNVADVKVTMRKCRELQSAQGWDKVMEIMDNKFKPKKETSAWSAFDELEDMEKMNHPKI